MADIAEITIDALVERYDALLLDAYGVLVHSGGALPGAAALITRLNAAGTPYWLLTNDASKLPTTAARRYQGFGLDVAADRIITSGALLGSYFAQCGLANARVVVLGPPDSVRYVEDAGGRVVGPDTDFEAIVIGDESGFPFLETVDTVLSALFRRIDRGAPVRLVLPNPDLIYPSRGGFGFASGSVAVMFEAALAARYPRRDDLRFARLGKPHRAIFDEALRRSGTRRMVMIGDQLETDVRGARAFGLDAALVDTGVASVSEGDIPDDVRPTYRLRSLD